MRKCRKCTANLSSDRYFNCRSCMPILESSCQFESVYSPFLYEKESKVINPFKTCKKCKIVKPISEYHSAGRSNSHNTCKTCSSVGNILKWKNKKRVKNEKSSNNA